MDNDKLTMYNNGLATVLEECNVKIDEYLELYKFEVKRQALQQKAEQTQKLIANDKKIPYEKMIYIQDYFLNNPDKIKEKSLYPSSSNNDDYTVFTSINNSNRYYLIYNTNSEKLYWADNTTPEKSLVSISLENTDNYPLINLLNSSYFHILSSQQDTISASQEPIETPSIPSNIAENLLHIKEENEKFASILRNFSLSGGSKKTTYKLNGEKVVLLHKNKKVQRSIYVKGNGKTKYCMIDKEYVLLSKVKNKIIKI